MKKLGPYKKYIIIAAIIQSIIVILMGYSLFKSRGINKQIDHDGQQKTVLERPVKQ